MERFQNAALWFCRQARRVVIFVFGITVLLIGIAMIVLPGPAVIVIPVGLAILATEFVWAQTWLEYARQKINTVVAKTVRRTRNDGDPSAP